MPLDRELNLAKKLICLSQHESLVFSLFGSIYAPTYIPDAQSDYPEIPNSYPETSSGYPEAPRYHPETPGGQLKAPCDLIWPY